MSYNLKQAKDYVRSKVKELKNEAIVDNMLTIDFNLAQVKVQSDLMEIGIKDFIKTGYLNGPRVFLPDDVMPVPNAVRDIRSSAGVKAHVSTELGGANNDLTFTAIEPGAVGNGILVTYEDKGTEVSVNEVIQTSSVRKIVIGFDSTLPDEEKTAALVMAAINAHIVASTLVVASLKEANTGAGVIVANEITLANGTGSGWKPCDERGIKDSNRMEDNYIEAASENYPRYVIKGDTGKKRIIEFYPKSIKYSEVLYYYTLQEMTADTDILGIALQYRELVLIEVIRKAYESLDMTEKMNSRNLEYQTKLAIIRESYQKGLQNSITEKQRIQTED